MIVPLIISFFILLVIGVPVAFAMALSALFALLDAGTVPLLIISQRMFNTLNSFPLVAVPLFVLAGELMNTGGITNRIIQFAQACVGHVRGGLGHVNIIASMLFAGVSGSATADAAGIGKILIPAMIQEGYDEDFSVAVTAASATIGPIIPPSIVMVVYGSMTNLSIGKLFLAGFLPGVLIGFVFLIISYCFARVRNYPKADRASFKQLRYAFRAAFLSLMAPVIIIGGIIGGVFTATEAGAVAVLYTLILSLRYGRLSLKNVYHILFRSAVTTSIILIILGCAAAFGWVIAREQLPAVLINLISTVTQNPSLQLLCIIAMLLLIGLFVEGMAALIILIPVLTPMSASLGIDPIQFATVIIVAIVTGTITPPVGLLLYVSCGVAEVPLKTVTKIIWIFIAGMVSVLLMIAYIPELTLFLPRVAFG